MDTESGSCWSEGVEGEGTVNGSLGVDPGIRGGFLFLIEGLVLRSTDTH